jgi:malonyl-CoA O-methyltransferase
LHALEFVDMHDLGDMLVATGFAAPVMDMEIVTLTYADVTALVRDLRRTGQTNVMAGRRRGLLGRHAWARVLAAYESMRSDGRLPATVELVYGHAWKGA